MESISEAIYLRYIHGYFDMTSSISMKSDISLGHSTVDGAHADVPTVTISSD